MKYFITFCLTLLIIAALPETMGRTWTNDKGQELEAELIEIKTDSILIRSERDEKTYDYPIQSLSSKDQAYIAKLAAKEPDVTNTQSLPEERLNKATLVEVLIQFGIAFGCIFFTAGMKKLRWIAIIAGIGAFLIGCSKLLILLVLNQ